MSNPRVVITTDSCGVIGINSDIPGLVVQVYNHQELDDDFKLTIWRDCAIHTMEEIDPDTEKHLAPWSDPRA